MNENELTQLPQDAPGEMLPAEMPDQMPENPPREESIEPPAPESPDVPAMPEAVQAGAERIYQDYVNQSKQAREIYPQLDLAQEMQNGRFVALLRSGLDVRTAYEAVHLQEILPAAMQYAAKAVEEKLASSLRASQSRPAENGMTGQGAVLLGTDPARLSGKDYAEICRRVARGERVSFG